MLCSIKRKMNRDRQPKMWINNIKKDMKGMNMDIVIESEQGETEQDRTISSSNIPDERERRERINRAYFI